MCDVGVCKKTYCQVFSLSAWTEGCNRPPGNGSGLVGMLVAELQGLEQLEGEGVLALERSETNTTAMYVISLGITERYRRCGIGHYLMTSLLDHVTSTLSNCWAVYLHVVSSNTPAIEFYRRFGFSSLTCIPGYYTISQRPQDGLLFIRYVNQGEPFSHSLSAYTRRYVTESSSCRLVAGLCQALRHWLTQYTFRNNTDSKNRLLCPP
ncbi:N-alpha-acetyltransferase 60 [Geodia barretti]|uniref:N-alpha-acetyltransferase 60 n=1 Tax=Geodia barretti TaxID=519541 RepID=A0AA35S391_GEOBA|nr:N-alpha-acetyltransferase 60 [Geodia barretti]